MNHPHLLIIFWLKVDTLMLKIWLKMNIYYCPFNFLDFSHLLMTEYYEQPFVTFLGAKK